MLLFNLHGGLCYGASREGERGLINGKIGVTQRVNYSKYVLTLTIEARNLLPQTDNYGNNPAEGGKIMSILQ